MTSEAALLRRSFLLRTAGGAFGTREERMLESERRWGGRLRPGAEGEGWAPMGEHAGCGGNGHRIQCSAAAFESMVLVWRAHWRGKDLAALGWLRVL